MLVDCERSSSSGIDLRQSGKEIIVAGVTVAAISNTSDFERQLNLAMKNRSTASTYLNNESSRSHFILQLVVTSPSKDRDGKSLTSKIHLIDLVTATIMFNKSQAGSEDNKRTGNSGARMVSFMQKQC